jgi:hypothetical protein
MSQCIPLYDYTMLIKRKKTKIAMRECKISKVCKKLPQLNSKKPINPVKKIG